LIRTHTYSLPYMRLLQLVLLQRWYTHHRAYDFHWANTKERWATLTLTLSLCCWFHLTVAGLLILNVELLQHIHTHTPPHSSPRVTHDTCLAIFSFNQLLYAFICISYELNWFAYARVWVTEAWWLTLCLSTSDQPTNQPPPIHTHSPSVDLVWSGYCMRWFDFVDSMVNQQLAFSCEIWCTADSLNPACWYLKANTQPTDSMVVNVIDMTWCSTADSLNPTACSSLHWY